MRPGYTSARMKRNTVVVVIVAVAAVFLLFNPIQRLRNRNPTVSAPPVARDTLAGLLAFAEADWQSPGAYIAGLFDHHDVVFLGEFYKIREQVQLVSTLIPELYAKGVRNLAIEYALSDSQPDIDALLAAPTWDEVKARRITFDWVVTWGYQEYIDIYHAAWRLDRSLPPGAPPFRIVALNVRQNWKLVQTDADLRNTATLHQILAAGIPDSHMADVLMREVVDRGGKALVFTSLQHAFTRYHSTDYEQNMRDRGFGEVRRMGTIVADRVGARACTVALDSPWPDPAQQTGLAYPVDGAINGMVTALPAGEQSGGWDTAGTPLGALPVRSSAYASPITDFVPPDAGNYAVENFPGPKPARLDSKAVQQAIVEEVAAIEQMLSRFR
jgi:hypothetical protein